jgi:hypothetical protein
VSEASTYQALRGHLANLRMAAAAEALPGLLDQAKAERRWSSTALLERLFALEVAAADTLQDLVDTARSFQLTVS